jgi:hypothetical protein
MLLVAGWLVARERPSAPQIALLVLGLALLQMVLVVLAIPILAAEVLLLASFIYWAPRQRTRASERMAPNAPKDTGPSVPLAPGTPN